MTAPTMHEQLSEGAEAKLEDWVEEEEEEEEGEEGRYFMLF